MVSSLQTHAQPLLPFALPRRGRSGRGRVMPVGLRVAGALLALGTLQDARGDGLPATPDELLDRLEASFNARDATGYLSLFAFATPEERHEESERVLAILAEEEVTLALQRARAGADAGRMRASAQVFAVTEPRGRVEEWRFDLERLAGGWAIAKRLDVGQIEGLVHLALDPAGFRADGLTLRLEDFELRMDKGTLFTSPASLGPTLLLFVGEGRVKVSPRPAAEREQLRQFCGSSELLDSVRSAFVRIHPADLYRVLEPGRLEPDPAAAGRLEEARRFYREQSQRLFVVDTSSLPRSPWWLLPGLGDASVTFGTRHHGELTFAVNSSEPEGLSLFDRARRRQICLYPAGGREPRYSEDEGRALDILHHDLKLRFEPARRLVEGEDTLKLRLLVPASTLRLRLDDAFKIESVTSREGGSHLFFRVRGQNSVMVSLGPLSGSTEELSLNVRFAGVHDPAPVEQEVLQVFRAPAPILSEVPIEDVLVYSNRTAWFPRGVLDDFATATLHFDAPLGIGVVTGGERVAAQVVGSRTLADYRMDQPGKYITAAVGRLYEVGTREEDGVKLQAFGGLRTRDEAKALLEQAAEMLRFYKGEFGPCPYSFLNLLLIQGATPGGHSPPGMIVLQQRPLLAHRQLRDDPASLPEVPDFFLAHELAHQWWGHGVAGENYRERWLAEGFAQYAAALWVRKSRGEAAFEDVLGRFSRWALRYSAQGPIHLGYRLGHIKADPQIYRSVVYDKAACVLHMLRAIVGEEAFRKGLVAFQQGHRFGKAGTDDLQRALEEAGGKPLGAYFNEWVYGTSLPELRYRLRVSPAGEAGFETAIDVAVSDLPGPVPLQLLVKHDGGPTLESVTLPPAGGRFLISTKTRPRDVEINADRGLLVRTSKSEERL